MEAGAGSATGRGGGVSEGSRPSPAPVWGRGLPFPRRRRVRASPEPRQALSGWSTANARKPESLVGQRLCGDGDSARLAGALGHQPCLPAALNIPAKFQLGQSQPFC